MEANTDDTNYMLPIVEQAQQEIFNLTERISSIRSKSFQEFDLERDLAKLNGFLVLLKQVESERWVELALVLSILNGKILIANFLGIVFATQNMWQQIE